jgi:hypothetical protein
MTSQVVPTEDKTEEKAVDREKVFVFNWNDWEYNVLSNQLIIFKDMSTTVESVRVCWSPSQH